MIILYVLASTKRVRSRLKKKRGLCRLENETRKRNGSLASDRAESMLEHCLGMRRFLISISMSLVMALSDEM